MTDSYATDSLGLRINAAARLAVVKHLEMDQQEEHSQKARAGVGGTDRLVTDDNSSVVSGPSSVVTDQNN